MRYDPDREEEKEPVYYCRSCLSLKIGSYGNGTDDECYCMDCSSTDIAQDSIFTWRKMYCEKYHKSYLRYD